MSDIFRPLFRSVEDKVANRREQLRKAQKTFRERRDQYLQTLEKTVKRLRLSESGLQNEVERLTRELALTKARLADWEARLSTLQESSHGGFHPSNGYSNLTFSPAANSANTYMSPSNDGSTSETESFASNATTLVWIETKNDQPVQMHVQRPDDLQFVSSKLAGANGNSLSPEAHLIGKIDLVYVAQHDAVIVAMEFVLKLESPCLPHLRQADDSSSSPASPSAKDTPHGHIHTVSAALLCCSPSPSPLSGYPSSSTYSPASSSAGSSWSVHKATLDRLLDISEDLPLDQASELTPVQMWYCIAQTPNFYKLRLNSLGRISDQLLAQVKCYGFGAVVRRDYLTKLLAEAVY